MSRLAVQQLALVAFVGLATSASLLVSCSESDQSSVADQTKPTTDVTPDALAAEINAGQSHLLLDVREPDEFGTGHLIGAINIPLGQLPTRLAEVPMADDIVTICRAGARGAKAAALLREHGYPRVRNLIGGILAWHGAIGTKKRLGDP